MPYIDEHHLVDLHKTIESKEVTEERLLNELRKQREEKEEILRKKDIFKWTSISLVMILVVGVTLYFVRPSVYVNDTYLQSKNKKLINTNEIDNYQQQISMLETKVESNIPQEISTIDYRDLNSEVIYAVQIAALENRDLSLYSEELRNINQYKDKPYNKYSLGNFTSLDDAKIFRKELIALGFQDAFVASYKNGKRIKIEDGL
ncbi:SPOR domain-containing protein [Galbibacter pacificus]|uniref:SPOR domain-containing protein n=1 Tax=Galbibacter pacificus TaxID=2996052 RepID=A0ABT6FPY3_9FLAO|nr:SPOR domain-containing protein [Galbibacter pacificus]MDG3582193.1 SPOR domain-containing protein [Galbibacter pacificus]MDG3585331.1 SPOR domain-containing protein [Galbibacter pacificus]